MSRILIALLALMAGGIALTGLPFCAAAQTKRVALVIGNSAYKHAPALTNPKNDATDIAAALKKHGFHVIEGFDLDKSEFDRKVRDFSAALKGSEAGLFFYAGHGLQVGGQNYLVPVDAKAETEDALDWEMLKAEVVQRAMERSTNTNLLFLDACRDNPLARNLARSMGTRSNFVGRGLATIESGVGTLISFSTQPGNVALDGVGRNSPFAGALVKQLSTSSDDVNSMLIAVRIEVMKETQRQQIPWEHTALTGRFYFNPAAASSDPIKAAPARLSEAAEAWDKIKDTPSVALLEGYTSRYQDTVYADLARAQIETLKKQEGVAKQQASSPAKTEASKGRRTYDQAYAITATGNDVCVVKKWSTTIVVDDGNILKEGSKVGRVNADGSFKISYPNLRKGAPPGEIVVLTGNLKQGSAGGKYSIGGCAGTLAIQ